MKQRVKPQRLRPGARIAVIAPSSGLAKQFPAVYRRGVSNLKKVFGFDVVDMPTVGMSSEELSAAPRKRVDDIHTAFADKAIDGIFTAIGGDDSVRLLPLIDPSVALSNPKPIMGSSDATTFLSYLSMMGLNTFYGPAVMSGLAQTENYPNEFVHHVKSFFFDDWSSYDYAPYPRFTHGYKDWSNPAAAAACKPFHKNPGPHVLQGSRPATGRLWGGCIEVLEFLKGTAYWPQSDFWNDVVLFLETSEEKPPPRWVGYFLRNYALQGVFSRIKALLIGRPKDYTDEESARLKQIVKTVVAEESGAVDLPVIMDLDFGHTDPKLILPLGGRIEVDPTGPRLELLESPFA